MSFLHEKGLSSQKMWFDKNYKTKLKVFKLAIARHYILMHFSTFVCKLLLNEELAIITFSLMNYLWRLYSRSNSQKTPALCETQQVLVHIAGKRREFV